MFTTAAVCRLIKKNNNNFQQTHDPEELNITFLKQQPKNVRSKMKFKTHATQNE